MMNATSPPWSETAYRIDLPHPVPDDLPGPTAELFGWVWRTTLTEPGFALVRFSGPVGSRDLRRVLFQLVEALPVRFTPERLGRFDQQVSSRFHRDGAPAASLLLLGYEASTVRSRLFVADAHRAAVEAGLGIREYLAAFNPMVPVGEARLGPHATELAVPHGESYVVAINNSLMPLEPANPLGVLHKAVIVTPDLAARRVINSVGLMLADDTTTTPKDAAAVEHFLTRDDLD
ncbi:MAG TPA: hypothetical protein VKE74_27935 [Gemmataceae bacterium]|nr:hypothetical protein [Gemmataceae bacterium]